MKSDITERVTSTKSYLTERVRNNKIYTGLITIGLSLTGLSFFFTGAKEVISSLLVEAGIGLVLLIASFHLTEKLERRIDALEESSELETLDSNAKRHYLEEMHKTLTQFQDSLAVSDLDEHLEFCWENNLFDSQIYFPINKRNELASFKKEDNKTSLIWNKYS